MRLAIVGDIHSNLQALEEVMRDIERERVDEIVCAGDIVGYGANPNECCKIVRRQLNRAVLGNHDISAITKDTSGMNPYAAAASRWTSSILEEESMKYLGSLKTGSRFEAGGLKAAMFHGSVESPTEYVFEDGVDEEMVRSSGSDILILGHTHEPYVKRFGSTIALNPGSVGQPRDGDPRASYAILDTGSGGCAIRRVDYDIEGASSAIVAAGLPRLLAERLRYGR